MSKIVCVVVPGLHEPMNDRHPWIQTTVGHPHDANLPPLPCILDLFEEISKKESLEGHGNQDRALPAVEANFFGAKCFFS